MGKTCFRALVCIAVALASSLVLHTAATAADPDWRVDWGVQRGFNISIDAEGFQFPTSIVFVPSPGSGPKDPLYFVTELKGAVKVVTNDRSVFTFAVDFFRREAQRFIPAIDDSVGLAGLCLDPEHGYVFVTFGYHDLENIQRNNVVRFQSTPGTFSLSPESQIEFTDVFASFKSIPSHQISACQVRDGLFYVNVADAGQVEDSRQLDSLLGKVLRMTLDGRPAPDNPFRQNSGESSEPDTPADYVWASGLRNPFGSTVVGDRIFVADNGPDIDRFLEIKEGGDYLWDGGNNSIGTSAAAILAPGRGVAQLDFYPKESVLFPSRFNDSFFLTVTGSPARHRDGIPAIISLNFDFKQNKVVSVPKAFVQHRTDNVQSNAALQFGPDGLYFAPLLPNNRGLSAVFKVQFDPGAEYPYLLEDELNPAVLMNTHGCFACHTLNNNQGGDIGPILDSGSLIARLETRLNSQEYSASLAKIDVLDQEPFISFVDGRRSVEQAEGLEKIQVWLQNRIEEPRFDDPNATMPNLGLSKEQAGSIARFLTGIDERKDQATAQRGFVRKRIDDIKNILPIPTRANAEKFLAAFFGVGLIIGMVGTGITYWSISRLRRRQKHQ